MNFAWLVVSLTLLASAVQGRVTAKLARRPRSPRERHWTLHTDNDLFAFTHLDQDYTGGVSVTMTDVASSSGSVRACVSRNARRSCTAARANTSVTARALEVGLQLFTPQDLRAKAPLRNDRPYASLLYASRSKLVRDPSREVAYQSTWTVGLLGLRLAEQVHRRVHAAVGAPLPAGYAHQISNGGEPTFRYAVSRYRLLARRTRGARHYTLRLDTGASVGNLTEVNAELAVRWRSEDVPWWTSYNEAGDYAGQPVLTVAASRARSRHVAFGISAGLKLRGRLYDTFLQGQFRSSDVAYSSSNVKHFLCELWLSVDVALANGVHIGYVVRHQTAELKVGRGARAFTWAGLTVTRGF